MAFEEKWEDEEEPTLTQKIKKMLFPPRKPKVLKIKNKKLETIPDTIKPEEITVEKEIKKKKLKHKPEQTVEQPTETTPDKQKEQTKDEGWEKPRPKKEPFIPQLDRTFPGPMFIKRIIATLLLLGYAILLIFVIRNETTSAIICFLTMIIFIDYLIITGPQKKEKWLD